MQGGRRSIRNWNIDTLLEIENQRRNGRKQHQNERHNPEQIAHLCAPADRHRRCR
jgi:hypothetical protein